MQIIVFKTAYPGDQIFHFFWQTNLLVVKFQVDLRNSAVSIWVAWIQYSKYEYQLCYKLTICARAIFERRETTDELIGQYAESPVVNLLIVFLTLDHLRW